MTDFMDKLAEFVCWINYSNAVRNKNSECGWIYVFCVKNT